LPISRLTQLQRDVLHAFFSNEKRFFLTGGAALAGFYLGHRVTDDLDLFTEEQATALQDARRTLEEIARSFGATIEPLADTPGFKRLLLRREGEQIKIDLVQDAQQLLPKVVLDGITIDSAEEITANKLTTLLSRSEIRDLVDLRELEAAGHTMESALPRAAEKDRGLTPGQLLEVLSEIRIGPDAEIPGGGAAEDLRRYLEDLIDRLARLAFPGK
jgi:hypothetical protein